MGIEKHRERSQFGPQDLGILDGPTPRAFKTIVSLCATAVSAPATSLCIFDDAASALIVRNAHGLEIDATSASGIPLTGSVAAFARANGRTTRVCDLCEAPHDTSVEFMRFGARAFLGSIVHGPAEEPIGVLAAMHHAPYAWSYREARLVEDMAYLLSQQIMLKASFATLRIMSKERKNASH